MTYQIAREEHASGNLTGREPYVLASNLTLPAHIVERRSDGQRFLLIGATTSESQARAWADRQEVS